MGKQIRADYSQTYLLPPSIEDWVPLDHPARFIRDFVESLNLGSMGFNLPEAVDGRPPYSADLLLKIWLYGYMNRLRSSRKLEAACLENMSLIWLTGAHYPDHNTIWRFWAVNKKALREVFRQAVFVAVKANLVGLVLHAVDGTKIAADVSRAKLWRRKELSKLLVELDASIDEAMNQVEQAESDEQGDYRLPENIQDAGERRQKIKEALVELEKINQDYLHPHDSDARMMKKADGKGMAFNAQIVVDEQSGLIVAEEVVNEQGDNGQLVPMVKAAEGNLGATAEETVADAGYYAAGQLAEAEQKALPVIVSMFEEKDRRWGKGELQKSNFIYDQRTDVYICPLGKKLRYEKTKRDRYNRYWLRVYRCLSQDDCPRRWECSRVKRGRVIERGEYEWAVEHQQVKQRDATKRELLRKRKAIVELVFAQIKEHQGFRRFSIRGLENVKTQWAMMCATFNLRKLYKLWVAGALVLT